MFEFEELDSSGYPTEEWLQYIEYYIIQSKADCKKLLDEIKPYWLYSEIEYWKETDNEYHLSTGGWSGNEIIIEVLMENILFWQVSWVQTRRGGHYIFDVGA